jgi:protein ImuA
MLPNGALVHAGLHEVVAASHGDGPAAGGFAVALMARLLASLARSNRGLVLWCARGVESREFGRLYGPGLQAMGLDPARLIIATAERHEDLLWAMEEGVKTPALAGVVGEVGAAGLTATRRLQLAARNSGVPAVILRAGRDARTSVARTQWRVGALPAVFTGDETQPFPARCRWRVMLERCRGAATGAWPRSWDLEWDHETHRFHMAAALAGRSVATVPGEGKIFPLRQTG